MEGRLWDGGAWDEAGGAGVCGGSGGREGLGAGRGGGGAVLWQGMVGRMGLLEATAPDKLEAVVVGAEHAAGDDFAGESVAELFICECEGAVQLASFQVEGVVGDGGRVAGTCMRLRLCEGVEDVARLAESTAEEVTSVRGGRAYGAIPGTELDDHFAWHRCLALVHQAHYLPRMLPQYLLFCTKQVVLGGVCRDLIINLESSLVVQQHRWDRPAARGGIEAAKESVTHGGDVGVLAGVIAHVKHRHHCFKLQSSSRVRVPHWDHAAHL